MAIQTKAKAEDAEALNERWDVLSADYDQYYNTMSAKARKTLQQAISNWQDWFYGNYDEWGPLDQWYHVYDSAKTLLEKEKQRGIAKEVPVDLPPQKEAIELDPIYIYGKAPKLEYEESKDPFGRDLAIRGKAPFQWGWILLGVATVALIAGKKKKRKR